MSNNFLYVGGSGEICFFLSGKEGGGVGVTPETTLSFVGGVLINSHVTIIRQRKDKSLLPSGTRL